jgi:IclR family transcriptional regulator, acetate operon repressor
MTTTEPLAESTATAGRSAKQSVQSVERAFLLLEAMADADGVMGVSTLASETGLPLPTIHRLVRTLVDLGYVHQDSSRRYVLGPRLIRLGERSARSLTFLARPHLLQLADQLEETVNLAMLDNDQIVYVAQAPSKKHSMRMFTEVGKRVSPHCTAVGKAIFATMSTSAVEEILKRTGMARMTEYTITDRDAFIERLQTVRVEGYALDEGEQEVGVHCVAVAVTDTPAKLALSVSGPVSRMTEEFVARAVPTLKAAALALEAELH